MSPLRLVSEFEPNLASSLVAVELVGNLWVQIVLLLLHGIQNVALNDRNLLPVVQDLDVVDLDLTLKKTTRSVTLS